MIKIIDFLIRLLRPRGQRSFLSSIKKEDSKILDVGCGNESSVFIKTAKPDSIVYGIDVVDFNQSKESKKLYEKYIIAQPEVFDRAIQDIKEDFDIVISNHNIEHCNDPESTFKAMVDKTKSGEDLYIATPSIYSVDFPSRGGGLNFYDDATHQNPVDLMKLFETESHRLECLFYSESCRPVFWRFFGYVMEFFSKRRKEIMLGTWDYYGFEQVIWIQKK